MEKMQIFNNGQFGKIRTITIEGEPWFVGKDVCAAFGDTNYRRSLGRLDADEKCDIVSIDKSMDKVEKWAMKKYVSDDIQLTGILTDDAGTVETIPNFV